MHPADHRLLGEVARTLAQPKQDPADSFVLHASLELLARAGLLAQLHDPDDRDAARARLRWLARAYAAAGDPVPAPPPVAPDPARLLAALDAGDLDEVDAQAVAIARVATAEELRRLLAAPVLASLGAAAHGSILLRLLVRAPGGPWPLGLARQALREMARHPHWRLRWYEDPDEPSVTAALDTLLLDVPQLGLPGSDFIFPIMNQAEASGVAPQLLRGLRGDAPGAARALARVAAWSMLQEPDDHVPYGWTHCLTMPQGAAHLADASPHAVAVAATYVVGFRAAEGTVVLDPAAPTPPADDRVGLAAYAAAHEDAHLAKYTLACLDAAGDDPANRSLYLAAATRLAHWWQDHDADVAGAACA